MATVIPLRSFHPLVFFQRSLVTFLVLTLSIAGYPAEAIAAQDQAPAQAQGPVDTSPENLDHLMAPIALYPDALLMQVLAAAVNKQEVLDAGNWLLENKSVQGTAIDDAGKKLGFSAATTALLHFPDVVDQMCSQIDWTGDVGAAFTADQAAVLASIQRLRAQAVQYGNLKTSQQQTVQTQTDNGKQVIVIQPANPQVVYVPQYNPQTVYVAAPPSGPSTGDVVAASVISFGVGMAVGAIFANNNNYCYPRWGYGGVYYGGHPYVRPPYRPVYPGYRPAYGYRPPANYPYHGGNRYNNNYYNNYKGGNNYRGGNNSYRGGGNTVNNVNVNVNKNNNNRPNNGNNNGYNKPGNNNNNNRPGNNGNNGGYNKPGNNAGNNNNRPGGANGNNGGYNKPGNGNNGNRPATPNVSRPAPDRGYSKPAGQTAQTRPGGGGQQARPQQPQARPAPTKQAPAFGGGGSSGRSTQAASQRGAASNAGRANGGGGRKR